MSELKEKVQDLRFKLNEIHHSWTRVTAAMWTEEKWAEERARVDEIKKELKELVPLRIAELEDECKTLNNRYSKLTKLKFRLFGVPKLVGYDQQRMRDITREIQDLKQFQNEVAD